MTTTTPEAETTTPPVEVTTTPVVETTTVKETKIDKESEKLIWVIVIAVFVASILILQKVKWF